MLQYRCEIVTVGNELLIGKILNTNAQWLAKRITNLGGKVTRITAVGDYIEEIASVIGEAIQRKPDLIITVGGLGPTFDDRTLEGIAKALRLELKVNEKALRMIREKYRTYFKEKGMERAELTSPRVKMATLPEGAEPLPNPVGTAPGVKISVGRTLIVALPGVPSEMKAIFNESIAPFLKEKTGGALFFEKSIHADGIMESTLAPLIDQVMRDNPSVYIKSHPKGEEKRPHIEIHMSTIATDPKIAKEKLERAASQLSKLIEGSGGKVKSSIN